MEKKVKVCDLNVNEASEINRNFESIVTIGDVTNGFLTAKNK